MRDSWYKKGLVVGIIILFLGLSIQSSIGIDIPIKKEVETIEDTEDCKPCQLEELISKEDGLKILYEEFSIINNKLEENPTPWNSTCRFLLINVVVSFIQLFLWNELMLMLFLGDLPDSLIKIEEFFIDRLARACDLYQNMGCGENMLCN